MSERERIVLVDLGTPGRWDSARVGTGLVIDAADTDGAQVVRRVGAAGTTSAIMATPTKGSWVAVVEIKTLTSGTVTVGVRQANARRTLAQSRLVNSARDHDYQIGTRTGGYSITATGTKYTAGITASTGTAWAQGDRFVFLYDAAAKTLTVRKNSSATNVATWTNLVGPLEIVGTPGGANSALRLVTDVDDVPWTSTHRPAGIWGRIATVGWMTPHNDTVLRNTYYDGRIDPESEPSYEERANIPMFDSTSQRSVGDFLAINTDRELDAWLTWTTRDELLTIRTGLVGQPFSAFVVEASTRIDELASAQGEEDSIRITPRDAAVLLEIPWQAEQYPVTTPLVALRGTTKPTGIGVLRGVPVTMTDATLLLYDLIDDAAFSISALYDQAVPMTLGTQYSVNNDRKGIKRLTNPAGKQVADIIGSVTDSIACVDAAIGDLGPWSGGAPNGWSVVVNGGSTVTNAAPGARFQAPPGGWYGLILAYGILPSAVGYMRIDVTISARTKGGLTIRLTDGGGGYIDSLVSAIGEYSIFVLKPTGVTGIQIYSNGETDITLSRIRIARVEAMDGLSAWMKHLATERGMLSIDNVDVAGIAAVAAVRPWPLCLYTGQGDQSKVIDILDRTCASVGCGWWFDSQNRLRMMAVTTGVKVPAYTLTNIELFDDISCEPLRPSNLSDRVGSVPFWSPHEDADIAGSVLTTSAGRIRAEEFKRTFISTVKGVNALASDYDYALNAEPTPTLLATAVGGQGLADLTTGVFRTVPKIYTGLAWRDLGNDPPISAVVNVISDQWDLDAGKALQVIGRRGLFSENFVTLTMVG